MNRSALTPAARAREGFQGVICEAGAGVGVDEEVEGDGVAARHFVEQASGGKGAPEAAVGSEEGVAEKEGGGGVGARDVGVHGGDVRQRCAGAEQVKVEGVHGGERRRHLGLRLLQGSEAGEASN